MTASELYDATSVQVDDLQKKIQQVESDKQILFQSLMNKQLRMKELVHIITKEGDRELTPEEQIG